MLPSHLTLIVATTLLACAAQPLHADQLSMPSKGSYQVSNAPVRGSLQSEVFKLHGEPESKTPGVGKPAISSWTYNGFKVFFEGERVIHTVGM